MAKRGAKPKPAHLRLIEGTRNVTRHGSEADLRKRVEKGQRFGPLACPDRLQGEARAAWNRYITPAGWLDASREAAALAFVELWAEFLYCPRNFPASKHGQLRAYMADLGLTDERNRGSSSDKKEKDEFFDD